MVLEGVDVVVVQKTQLGAGRTGAVDVLDGLGQRHRVALRVYDREVSGLAASKVCLAHLSGQRLGIAGAQHHLLVDLRIDGGVIGPVLAVAEGLADGLGEQHRARWSVEIANSRGEGLVDVHHLDEGAACAGRGHGVDPRATKAPSQGVPLDGLGDLGQIVSPDKAAVLLHVGCDFPSYLAEVEVLESHIGQASKRAGQHGLDKGVALPVGEPAFA